MKLAREPIIHKLTLLYEEAEERDAQRRAAKEGQPYLNLKKKAVDPSALGIIPGPQAEGARAATIALKGKRL
ncbi:MAG: hypothetical protein HYW00_00820 [Candidatus Colwellbacteria bacterium]|nr:hypothetical protein [Candidatus Colwellbacteria bacterium]